MDVNMDFKKDKNLLRLYAISQRDVEQPLETFYEKLEALFQGGVTLLQLREKHLSTAELRVLALRVKEICDEYAVPLIINDYWQLALEIGAAGVHMGLVDGDISAVRKIAPPGFIIGATAKTVANAQAAERAGADYLGTGALFASNTKSEAKRIEFSDFMAVRQSVAIPIVAIGGITEPNLPSLAGLGMDGVAISSDLFRAEDSYAKAQRLRKLVDSLVE